MLTIVGEVNQAGDGGGETRRIAVFRTQKAHHKMVVLSLFDWKIT
jgi:hypothetical protein